MIFYHGTSVDAYEHILKEGVLFGKRGMFQGHETSRCTYLATEIEEAKKYGDVVLKVEYDIEKNKRMHNYCDGCWQIRVYEPIALTQITRL